MDALIRGLALGLWAAVLLRSSVDGRLDLLLRSGFHPLIWVAGGLLLLLGLLQKRLISQKTSVVCTFSTQYQKCH